MFTNYKFYSKKYGDFIVKTTNYKKACKEAKGIDKDSKFLGVIR